MSTSDRLIQGLAATPLARTVADTATDIWNDSCAVDELEYAVASSYSGSKCVMPLRPCATR